MRRRSDSKQPEAESLFATANVGDSLAFHFQGVSFERFNMNSSIKCIGVTLAISFAVSFVDSPKLVAQNRFATMQNMAIQRPPAIRSMTGQSMSGQTMTSQTMSPVPTGLPGLNPNLGSGNLGGFGTTPSPFAGPFGSPFWNPYGLSGLGGGYYGGSYGLGSLLGQYVNPVGVANPPAQAGANGGNAAGQAGAGDKAAQAKEKVENERLANRRKQFDEMRNEREKAIQEEQRRSRDNPTLTEIVSGKALNDLLDDLRKLGAGIESANSLNALLPLDRAGLQHINVTLGIGNIALLKHGGRLDWPTALTGPEFRDARDRLTGQVSEVVGRMTSGGEVDNDMLRRMSTDVELLQAMLRGNARALSFEPFFEAKRFLQSLSDSLVALRQPDATNHFTGQYVLNAQTVLAAR
jgi:hypothetical protein